MLVLPRASSWPINPGTGSPFYDRLVWALVPISLIDDLQTRFRGSSPLAMIRDPFNRGHNLGRIAYELPCLTEIFGQRTRPTSLNAEASSQEAGSSMNNAADHNQPFGINEQVTGRLDEDARFILVNTGHAFHGHPKLAGFRLGLPEGMRTPSSHTSSLSLSSGRRLSGLFSRPRSVTPSVVIAATNSRIVQTPDEPFQELAMPDSPVPSEEPGLRWNQNLGTGRSVLHDLVDREIQLPSPASDSVRAEAPVSDQEEARRHAPSQGKKRKRSQLVPREEEEDDIDGGFCPTCKKRKSEHHQIGGSNGSEEDEDEFPRSQQEVN